MFSTWLSNQIMPSTDFRDIKIVFSYILLDYFVIQHIINCLSGQIWFNTYIGSIGLEIPIPRCHIFLAYEGEVSFCTTLYFQPVLQGYNVTLFLTNWQHPKDEKSHENCVLAV